MRWQLALEKPRQVRPDTHGKQTGADDGRELQHQVAKQIRRQRGSCQLVHQSTGGNDKDAGQQRDLQWPCNRRALADDVVQNTDSAALAMNGGRHNDADAQTHGCDHHAECHVLL